MTEQEAIKFLKSLVLCGMCTTGLCEDCERKQAKDVALQALNEIQKYREIGTVEECREAMARQQAKKTGESYINGYGNKKAECLNCHCIVMHPANYCKFCGQKLDWNE